MVAWFGMRLDAQGEAWPCVKTAGLCLPSLTFIDRQAFISISIYKKTDLFVSFKERKKLSVTLLINLAQRTFATSTLSDHL